MTNRIWRHKKRGSTYAEIGRAELQVATAEVREGSRLVIYRDDSGKLWARERGEFEDGRFEEVPAPTRSTRDPRRAGIKAAILTRLRDRLKTDAEFADPGYSGWRTHAHHADLLRKIIDDIERMVEESEPR